MKPFDLLVALKIMVWNRGPWTLAGIAQGLGVDPARVQRSIKKLESLSVLGHISKKINRQSIEEIIFVFIKYAYPAVFLTEQKGMLTAHSAPPLNEEILSDMTYVWASKNSSSKGKAIKPIHKNVVLASERDGELYRMLSLIEAYRAGQAREKELAKRHLLKMIKHYTEK